MSAAGILAIVQLVAALQPPVVSLINNLMNSFDKSGATPEEILKEIDKIAAALKPLQPK